MSNDQLLMPPPPQYTPARYLSPRSASSVTTRSYAAHSHAARQLSVDSTAFGADSSSARNSPNARARMNFADTVARIQALGFPCAEKDFATLDYDRARHIYQYFVKLAFQPDYAFTDENEIYFLDDLKSLAAASGVHDFSHLTDLLQPNPKRTRRIIHAIVETLTFRDELFQKWNQTLAPLISEEKRAEQVVLELTCAKRVLQQKEEECRANAPQTQALQLEITQLEARLKEAAVQKTQVGQTNDQLQKELGLLSNEIARLENEVQRLQSEIQQKRQMLPRCPEDVQREWNVAMEQMKQMKLQNQNLETSMQSMAALAQSLEKQKKLLETAFSQLNQHRQRKSEIKALKEQFAKLSTDSVEESNHQLKAEMTSLQKRLVDLSATWHALASTMSAPQACGEPSVEQQTSVVATIERRITQLWEEVQKAQEQHNAKVNKLLEAAAQLEQAAERFAQSTHRLYIP